MKTLNVRTILLITLAVVLIFQAVPTIADDAEEKTPVENDAKVETPDQDAKKPEVKVTAYYFHGRKRCMSCRTIELFTHDALLKNFSEELKDGQIEWKVENYIDPKNKLFKNTFKLFTQSVVLVEMKGEEIARWKNLKEVWELKGDKDAFSEHIQKEMMTFIAEGK